VVRGVLFDFDGTLTRPGALDFAAIRRAIGCPAGRPILEYLAALDDQEERRRAERILDGHELRLGILTRNSRASVREALARFPSLREDDFAAIVCREDGGRPKPYPDGVHEAARRLGCAAAELVVVGDYVFDIEAGWRAGSHTVLLANGTPPAGLSVTPDVVIDRLAELPPVIERLRQRG
jgi:hydrogenase expression/formation protein HypE